MIVISIIVEPSSTSSKNDVGPALWTNATSITPVLPITLLGTNTEPINSPVSKTRETSDSSS